MVAAALAFCAPAWSDAGTRAGAKGTERMCYCDCDAKPGSLMCAHMCELAKYENRSWATSCHKKTVSEPAQPSSAPGAHSTKDNGMQEARR